MALRGSGTIVHISSDAAVNPYPTWGAYGTAKAAQDHLSRILAAELEATGVRVLAIDPGDMDTDLHRQADPTADPSTLQTPDAAAQQLLAIVAADLPTGSRLSAPSWEPA
jgi:NAD(P)-dependent dehydrogenase (short-subunit alcohol dehydrogenase family)